MIHRNRGIDTVVAGRNLPNCPRATLFDASERDYRTVLATDATSQTTDRACTIPLCSASTCSPRPMSTLTSAAW